MPAPLAVDSDAVLAAVVRSHPDPVVLLDHDGTIRYVSERSVDVVGAPPGHYVGRNLLEVVAPSSVGDAVAAFAEFTDPARPDTGFVGPPVSLELLRADGHTVACDVRLLPPPAGFDGLAISVSTNRATSVLYDLIEVLVTSDDLDASLAAILRVIAEESPNSVPVIGRDWDGSGFSGVVGSPEAPAVDGDCLPTGDELRSMPWSAALASGRPHLVDGADLPAPWAARAAAAGLRGCWSYPVARRGDAVVDAVLVVWRRTPGPPPFNLALRMERMAGLVRLALDADRARQVLEASARTDSVTGLPNRRALLDRLRGLDGDPPQGRVGVLYCDLDDFKPVNDLHGHRTGDRVLEVLGQRIRSSVRGGDLVARVGGDEFVVVCASTLDAELAALADRLLDTVRRPISIDGLELAVGMSVGWSAVDGAELGASLSAERLVEQADAALLRAKAAGKGRAARGV